MSEYTNFMISISQMEVYKGIHYLRVGTQHKLLPKTVALYYQQTVPPHVDK